MQLPSPTATDLPVSVDLENGYGPEPADAAAAISHVARTGAVGASIEDYDPVVGLYEFEHAVERVAAAERSRALPFPFTLTARAENFLRGNSDLDDTISRLRPLKTPAPMFVRTEAGATRISLGGSLTFVAVGAMVAAAEEIATTGIFSSLSSSPSSRQIREWLVPRP